MSADSAVGFDRAPDRYSAKGRETIDRMRDLAYAEAERFLRHCSVDAVEDLADLLYAYHCDATALKYEDRTGLNDDAEQDQRKARWYRQMAAHVRGNAPDPRHERPGFVPYARPSDDLSTPG